MAETQWYAAILAGGAGTRFWPASRRNRPKPFIELTGEKVLLQLTAERLAPVVGEDRLLYVVGEHLVSLTREAVPGVKDGQLVVEPIARNTLGAVLLAMGVALGRSEDPYLSVFPSDHLIGDTALFQRCLRAAFQMSRDHVVAMGIVPTRPETGFGYIRAGKAVPASKVPEELEGLSIPRSVERFIEKPNLEVASRFVQEGAYLWNAGIFVFRVRHFLEHVRQVNPLYGEVVMQIAEMTARGPLEPDGVASLLAPLPNLNIDKAVMETCQDMLVLPAAFPWSDVGSWDALFEDLVEGDSLVSGDAVVMGGGSNVVVSTSGAPFVACVEVEGVVVVATPDAVLVTARGKGQEVGKLVKNLADQHREELL